MRLYQYKTIKILAVFIAIFGLLTLRSGGSVIWFEEARIAAGDILMEIVWFNFLAGFLYVVGAWGLWKGHPWVLRFSLVLFIAYLVMFSYLLVHVSQGGPYETRTLIAMTFRTLLWGVTLTFLGVLQKKQVAVLQNQ